ncbi:MAG: adenylyltransferase/cytidyltransferase family protein [bacterium]|nr:adenylyltransferase/cytidyltransferase family protein [bacterium]
MKKVGVIVGRFQVPELHAGHRYLVETVIEQCDHVLVVLGLAKIVSERNPFSQEARAALFRTLHEKIRLAEIADHPSDEEWSNALDQIIIAHFPDADVTLYGSRDSFLLVYSGRFKTMHLPPVPAPSGTDIRKKLLAKRKNLRAGRRTEC